MRRKKYCTSAQPNKSSHDGGSVATMDQCHAEQSEKSSEDEQAQQAALCEM